MIFIPTPRIFTGGLCTKFGLLDFQFILYWNSNGEFPPPSRKTAFKNVISIKDVIKHQMLLSVSFDLWNHGLCSLIGMAVRL